MSLWRWIAGSGAAMFLCGSSLAAGAAVEAYQRVPMPSGIQVVITELEGPVFADARGKTLYQWPARPLRNGMAGEQKGSSSCGNEKHTQNAGLVTRYPGGLVLPDADTRLSCVEMWPPALARKGAKPVGNWSLIDRADGTQQWAYEGSALYTSSLDRRKGDVLGGSKRRISGEGGAPRQPVAPPPDIPPGFLIAPTATGRMLTTEGRASVYASDADPPGRSHCNAECLQTWTPMLAPAFAQPRGDWSVIERAEGVYQWAFRRSPLYSYRFDTEGHRASLRGSDQPGWHNVYTMRAPEAPKGFTVQDASSGTVLADSRGRTVYLYKCIEDTPDQFECDHPDFTQAYRFAICGANDPAKCQANFPYVIAPKGARSPNKTWSVIAIDPQTGKRASGKQANALQVWAYRDRPVFTFSGDAQPGDIRGNSWGNFQGERNGFKAFWIRDDFFNNASSL